MKLLALALVFSFTAQAQTRLSNASEIRKALGNQDYKVSSTIGQVKVAVFDNGFAGYEPNKGLLPSRTTLVSSPGNPAAFDPHGLGMAQILWGVTGFETTGPDLYLINTNGFTNLKSAVDYVIQNKIQIVLYAQTWDFGGNFNGRGFINSEVNRATDRGIVWINASGNIGGAVYGSDLSVNESTGYLNLPGSGNTLRFTSQLDSNPVTVTLSWNDFTDSEKDCTKKDLDIFAYNDLGTQVASGTKVQKGEARGDEPDDKRSCYAREEFTLQLNRGDYTIKIQDRSKNFDRGDRIRVVVASEQPGSVSFTDANAKLEVGIPADNSSVITVGDCSELSAAGWTSDGRAKPDIAIKDSQTSFTDGKRTMGSSNAAAMVAGAVATMMAEEPMLDMDDMRSYLRTLREKSTTDSNSSCRGTPVWRTPSPQELIQIVK